MTKLSHESVMVISYPAAQHTPVHKLDIRLVMCDVIGEDIDNDEADDTSKDTSSNRRKLVQMKRMESETTSYDWSTDSESLR